MEKGLAPARFPVNRDNAQLSLFLQAALNSLQARHVIGPWVLVEVWNIRFFFVVT